MYAALVNILGGKLYQLRLPAITVGTTNPLLWWAATDMLKVSPAKMDAGIETMFSILLRGGIQRTYSIEGTSCITNMEMLGESNWNF